MFEITICDVKNGQLITNCDEFTEAPRQALSAIRTSSFHVRRARVSPPVNRLLTGKAVGYFHKRAEEIPITHSS
jgi:hypothetical protein